MYVCACVSVCVWGCIWVHVRLCAHIYIFREIVIELHFNVCKSAKCVFVCI